MSILCIMFIELRDKFFIFFYPFFKCAKGITYFNLQTQSFVTVLYNHVDAVPMTSATLAKFADGAVKAGVNFAGTNAFCPKIWICFLTVA
jgi:hypothetical protein